jgi:hypothetical protein
LPYFPPVGLRTARHQFRHACFGPVNTTVTITGNKFSAAPAANVVWFGSVRARHRCLRRFPHRYGANRYQLATNNSHHRRSDFRSLYPVYHHFSDNGQFIASAFSARTDVPTGSGPQFICNADLDGDGKPDLIVANGDSNTVTIYHNNSSPGTISFTEVASFTMGSNGYPSVSPPATSTATANPIS